MSRNFRYGIKNLFYWLPVVWADRQWGEYFLFLMLRRKLGAMEAYFRSGEAWVSSAMGTANRIRICVTLLERKSYVAII